MTASGSSGSSASPSTLWAAYAPRVALEWIETRPWLGHRVVDGGMVFLDISGFTALSERLATLGRVGAEEITDVISGTVERLMRPAYDRGGSLLSFGGDALLLLFEGDDGTTAAEVGHRMMTLLLEGNPLHTRAGPVELGMTVGVHAGSFDMTLAGEHPRQLILAGPDVSEVLRVEAAADRGQVLVSERVAHTLPAHMLGETIGHGLARVLTGRPDGRARPAPPLVVGESARDLLSPQVAEMLEQGRAAGQHRMACVAFVKVAGTDALRAARGPDGLAEALDGVVGAVQAACDTYDVCLLSADVDVDGIKLILVTGMPRTHGDDADRILQACRQIADAGLPLPPRIGVARGPVFAGVVGPPYRQTYTALGDTVNLAARVMGQARPGELLATPPALNAARTLFGISGTREFMAKGKAKPVTVFEVGAEVGIKLRRRADDHTFVGRQAEMEQLGDALQAAQDGRGSVAVITGPPGIGKSRAVDELQDHHPLARFVLAACQETAQHRPFYAAAQIMRALLGGSRTATDDDVLAAARRLLDTHPSELHTTGHLPLLARALGGRAEDTPATAGLTAANRIELTRQMIIWLLQQAHPGPLVLVVEDGQWGDAESRALLDGLTSSLDEVPWLILLTARSLEGLGKVPVPEGVLRQAVPLPPLLEDEAQSLLLEDAERGRISLEAIQPLLERGAGNPLFLIELGRAVAAGADGGGEIEQVVQERLDTLPGGDHDLLARAAVLGVEFSGELLAQVLGRELDDDDMDGVRGYLSQMRSGPLRFDQTLYQEVMYSTIPFRTREELHAQVADAIEGDPRLVDDPDALLARHRFLAGDMGRAWEHCRTAGEAARRRNAPSSAAELYRQAITAGRALGEPPVRIAEVQTQLGRVLEAAGAVAQAAEAYVEASAVPGDHLGPTLLRLARVHEKLGEYPASLAWLDRAAQTDLPVGRIAAERALVLQRMGDHVAGVAAARIACESDDPHTRGRGLLSIAWSMNEEGDVAAAEIARQSAEMLETAGVLPEAAKARVQLAWALMNAGDWSGAASQNRLSAQLGDTTGDRIHSAICRMNLAEILADQGHFADAAEELSSARMVLSAAGHRAAVAFADHVLGRLRCRTGRGIDGRETLLQARKQFIALDAGAMADGVLVHIAEGAAFEGLLTHPEGRLADAVDVEPASRVLARARAVQAWHDGDVEGVVALGRAALALALEHGDRYEQLLAQTLLKAVERFGITGALDDGAAREAAGAEDAMSRLGVVDPLTLAVGPVLAAG